MFLLHFFLFFRCSFLPLLSSLSLFQKRDLLASFRHVVPAAGPANHGVRGSRVVVGQEQGRRCFVVDDAVDFVFAVVASVATPPRLFSFFFFLGSSRRHALHSRCVAAASVVFAIVFVIVAVDQEKQHQQQQSGTAAAAVVSTDVLRRRRRFFLDIGPPAPAPGTPLESPPTGPALRHHHAALLREYDVKFKG